MKVELRELVSPKEAAEIRGISVQGIYHLMQRGRFTILKVSGKKFLLRKEVETFKPDVGGRPKTGEKTITKASKKR